MYFCYTMIQFRLFTNVLSKIFCHSILSQLIQNYFMLGNIVGRITKIQLLKGAQLVFKRCQTCLYFLSFCTSFHPLRFITFQRKNYFDILIRFRLTQAYEKVAKDFAGNYTKNQIHSFKHRK